MNKTGKALYKLMIIAIYEETMENLRKSILQPYQTYKTFRERFRLDY